MEELNMGADMLVNESANSGNLHVLIIAVSVCAVFGIILGILSGRRAAKK